MNIRVMPLIVYLSFSLVATAQDTLPLATFNDGTRSFNVITKTDTLLVYTYAGGQKESIRKYKNHQLTGTYKRWYKNGKLMWEKELSEGNASGKTIFYNEKGIKLAELIMKNNVITDTVFLLPNTHLVLGKITSTSKVYGGMEQADGSSNIEENSGPYVNFQMYAVKIDSLKRPVFIQNFKSDDQGDFFLVVPEGNIAFFPKNVALKTLLPGQYLIPGESGSSGHSGWDVQSPLRVKKQDTIKHVKLHHISFGYAP